MYLTGPGYVEQKPKIDLIRELTEEEKKVYYNIVHKGILFFVYLFIYLFLLLPFCFIFRTFCFTLNLSFVDNNISPLVSCSNLLFSLANRRETRRREKTPIPLG